MVNTTGVLSGARALDLDTVGAVGAVQMAVASGVPATLKTWGEGIVKKWLAGTIGHPYVREVRDNLDEVEARSKVNMMLAEEIGRQAIADPEVVERYKARILGDLFRKQVNLEAVGAMAEEALESDPQADAQVHAGQEPDPDWMGAFTREAENASSEGLRRRLAGVLAGEIKKPGSFARSTVRLIGDLEQDLLTRFKQLLDRRYGGVILSDDTWTADPIHYNLGLELENMGLVSGTTMSGQDVKPGPDGFAYVVGGSWALSLKVQPTFSHRTSVWVLTRAGREVADLIDNHDERATLTLAFGKMNKEMIDQAWLGRVFRTSDTSGQVMREQMIWSKSTVPTASVAP